MAIVYEGRVFSVEVETVRLPNGHEHEVAIVRHRPAVVLIPMQDAEHVTLVRQYRHSIRRDLWEFRRAASSPARRRRPRPRASARKRPASSPIASSGLAGSTRRPGTATRR
jgi:hypothetical protein